MFDIGMTELLVIGIVALIVVGPKDLPGMFRTLGRFTGKMRGMAREFQRAMEDAADESGVKDIGRDLKGYSNPKKYGLDKLNEAADQFEKWDPMTSPKSGKAAKRGPETEQLAETRRAEGAATRAAAAERTSPAKSTGTAAETPLSAGRAEAGEDRDRAAGESDT